MSVLVRIVNYLSLQNFLKHLILNHCRLKVYQKQTMKYVKHSVHNTPRRSFATGYTLLILKQLQYLMLLFPGVRQKMIPGRRASMQI